MLDGGWILCNIGGAEPRRSNFVEKNSTREKSDFGFPTADVPRPVPEMATIFLYAATIGVNGKMDPR